MPLVTIIIPVYNAQRYLKKCLNSLLQQTYSNIEIITIDDASTDKSSFILKEYAKKYNYFHYIRNSKNEGVGFSRNKGIALAKGEYFFFLDADDFLKENAIETLVSLAFTYQVPLVTCAYQNVLCNRMPKQKTKSTKELIFLKTKPEFIENELGMVWNKLYHKDLLKDLKFPEHIHYEDNPITYPILTNVEKMIYTNKILYYYRRHIHSFMFKANLFVHNGILDLYKVAALMKENCISLGTYTKYKDVIDKVILEKIVDASIQCSTWLNMKQEDKKELLTQLYLYNQKNFSISKHDIETFIDKRTKNKFIANLRKKIIFHYIQENRKPVENNLEEMKKIIDRYTNTKVLNKEL